MRRRMLLFGTLGLGVIIGLVFVLIGNGSNDANENAIAEYCSRNETAAFCVDRETSDDNLALDLLDTLIENFSAGYTNELCDDIFYGKVENYCKLSKENILPSNSTLLSNEYTALPVYSAHGDLKEGIYDVYTHYLSGLDAYVVRVAVIKEMGVPVISGISYSETPERLNLHMSDYDVRTLILTITQAEKDDDFCEMYFIESALTTCQTEIVDAVPSVEFTKTSEIIEIGVNEFIVTLTNEDETASRTVQVMFDKVDSTTVITEIEIKE